MCELYWIEAAPYSLAVFRRRNIAEYAEDAGNKSASSDLRIMSKDISGWGNAFQ